MNSLFDTAEFDTLSRGVAPQIFDCPHINKGLAAFLAEWAKTSQPIL